MKPSPPAALQKELCESALNRLTRHDSRERNVLRYLLDEYLKREGEAHEITGDDILREFPEITKEGCRALMMRLRGKCGSAAPDRGWAIAMSGRAGNYAVSFGPQQSVATKHGAVNQLWMPYLGGDKPVRLYYPEPHFFRDRRHTYFRHPDCLNEDNKRPLSYLKIGAANLTSCHTFVPAGVVGAMMSLIGYFQTQLVQVRATPIRTGHLHPEDEHIILFGTPATTPSIGEFETPYPFNTTPKDGIFYMRGADEERRYEDDELEVLSGIKYVLITRTVSSDFPRRVVTTIAACRLSRTVEAVTKKLAMEEEIVKAMLDKLGGGATFPKEFQALFWVRMSNTRGGERIFSVGLEDAESLDGYLKGKGKVGVSRGKQGLKKRQ